MTTSLLSTLVSMTRNFESFPKMNNNTLDIKGEQTLTNNDNDGLDIPTSFKYISLGAILVLLIFFFGVYLWKISGK